MRLRRRLALFLSLSLSVAAAVEPVDPLPAAADEQGLSPLERLGKRLFEDPNLSEPPGLSCAGCHDARTAFRADNGSPVPGVARGAVAERIGRRKVPTIMYTIYNPAFGVYGGADGKPRILGGQFWDGRAADMFEQARAPMLDPLEMNNASTAAVVAKVRASAYAGLVESVFGADVFADPEQAMNDLSSAIFAYEWTERFAPFASKFDDVLRGEARFTPLEEQGFALFKDPAKGNCIACHAGKIDSRDPKDWPFTDFSYAVLGAPRNPAIPVNADPGHYDLGLCGRPGLDALLPPTITRESLCGAFKAPTLRNVAVSAPYFHNGVFATLREAVAFDATRDTDPARWYPSKGGVVERFNDLPDAAKANVTTDVAPYDRQPGQAPRISGDEIDALVAFLHTLTDRGQERAPGGAP